MNEDEVLQDTETLTVGEESLEEPVIQEEQAGETQPDSSELERKNRELYARAKKAEEELKKFKAQPKAEETPTNSSPGIEERLERHELMLKGYSADEVDEIMSLGGQKALGNEIIKAGIEAKRKARKSLEATPSESGKSPIFRKFTEDELRAMPTEELEKLLRNR
jgi:hypothetical protein